MSSLYRRWRRWRHRRWEWRYLAHHRFDIFD
jgi:hypothetical protein